MTRLNFQTELSVDTAKREAHFPDNPRFPFRETYSRFGKTV